jgi:uroporphyrinogen decarboxylase
MKEEIMSRMTPRERILSATAHRQPDRVPFSWGFGPTPEMRRVLETYLSARGLDWERLWRATDDKRGVGPAWRGPLPAGSHAGIGIFGIKTRNANYGDGSYEEFADFPLAGVTDPAVIDRYPWPDAAHYDTASLRRDALAVDPERRHALCYGGGNPFEIYCWMTGLEEALCNLLVAPEVVTRALDHITSFFEARMRRVLREIGDLTDLVFLADDLGSQTGLLLARDLYRELLQPFHRRLAACSHALAPQATVMFHSDGAVFDVLPDLIDAGIDMFEAVQVDAAGMVPERLKTTFGARLSFHGAISVQQLLPHADAATVANECRQLVAVLGRDGGYIAAPTHAIQVGTPPENVMAMLETVLGPEDYAAALRAASR